MSYWAGWVLASLQGDQACMGHLELLGEGGGSRLVLLLGGCLQKGRQGGRRGMVAWGVGSCAVPSGPPAGPVGGVLMVSGSGAPAGVAMALSTSTWRPPGSPGAGLAGGRHTDHVLGGRCLYCIQLVLSQNAHPKPPIVPCL